MACTIEQQQELLCDNSHLWGLFKDDDYEFIHKINKGSYGVVYRARDRKTGEIVAVKEQVRGVCRSTLTEISIMKSLPPHPCIVGFKRAAVETEDLGLYVVMEHMDMDLRAYLERSRRRLMVDKMKHIMKRMLEGLEFVHRWGLIHRDIKPANILIRGDADEVKVCDFGLSVSARAAGEARCVGTRGYMAPEVVAGGVHTCAMDLWSVGCVMAELTLNGRFLPVRCNGTNEQLQYMVRNLVALLRRMSTTAQLTIAGVHLMKRLLEFDPDRRITAHEALHHPWFFE